MTTLSILEFWAYNSGIFKNAGPDPLPFVSYKRKSVQEFWKLIDENIPVNANIVTNNNIITDKKSN